MRLRGATPALLAAATLAVVAASLGCERRDGTLSARVADLERRLERQEAMEDVRKVAYAYAYYMDNALLDQVKGLFADEMSYCELAGYGRYEGREGCITVWTSVVGPGLQNADGHLRFGRLIKHYMLKPVVTIADDGRSANARFDYMGFSGVFGVPDSARHQVGVYRLGFRKERGVWKISRFSLAFDAIDFDFDSWSTNPGLRCPRNGVPAPDAPPGYTHMFPETGVVPFHFPNPVTGEPVEEYVNPVRYWEGTWPGEFGERCRVRDDAPREAETRRSPALRSTRQ